MKYLILLVFIPPLLLGCIGVPFTWQKLEGMKQIRGWKPGATIKTCTVTDKLVVGQYTHWLSWDNGDIRVPGDHRINLPENVANRYEVGSDVDIVYLPNDSSPYHRDGIYADDGNFAFDYVLLTIEVGMIVVSVIGAAIACLFLRRLGRERGSRTISG